MIVNSISPQQSISWYSKPTDMKTVSVEKSSFSISETVANTQDLNFSGSDSTNIWEEVASKYDVRKASFDEIKAISKELYDAGEISVKEVAFLTFDRGRATNYLKQNMPVLIPDSFDMYETTSNSNGERDWIAEFEARAQKDFKYGNLIGYQNKMEVLKILQQLDN